MTISFSRKFNILGSDYHLFPHTDAVVICKPISFETADLIKFGLGKGSVNHGVSYIETGPSVYVTLYTNNDLTGSAYHIDPKSSVALSKIPINGGKKSWNDAAESIAINGGTFYLVQGLQKVFPPFCAVLYATNPKISPNTMAFVACGNPSYSGETDFTQDYIESFGIVQTLKDFSAGVSYITAGEDTTITIYDGVDCGKDYDNEFTIYSGKTQDLTKITLTGKKNDRLWNDVPLSFSLSWKKSG